LQRARVGRAAGDARSGPLLRLRVQER
jgi:hypothetical protein